MIHIHDTMTESDLPHYKDQSRPHQREVRASSNPESSPVGGAETVLPLVEAIPIEPSDLIEFHPSDPSNLTESNGHLNNESKKNACQISRTNLLWMGAVVVLISVVIGGFCGAGKCGSTYSMNVSSSPSSTSNISTIPVSSPVTEPTAEIPATEAYLRNISLISTSGTNDEYMRMAEDMAIRWILDLDPLMISIAAAAAAAIEDPVDQFRLRQRFALVNFWYAMTLQNETESWTQSNGWLVESDECDWFGITCMVHEFDKDVLGNQSVVVDIALPSNALLGRLSPNLGLLERLRRLDVGDNQIRGPIPTSFHRISLLEVLSLRVNFLTGTIPEEIGELSHLVDFSVYDNRLNGTIPSTIGQWNNVDRFDIAYTGLGGVLPESMRQWTNITLLSADGNALSGSLPNWIGQWTWMEEFRISSNRFNGTLPPEIGSWSKIRIFSIEYNSFIGTIPESIVNWTKLEVANFSENAFTGILPSGICTVANFTSLVVNLAEVSCDCCTNSEDATEEPTIVPTLVSTTNDTSMRVEEYILSIAPSGGKTSSQTMDAELFAIAWLAENPLGLDPNDSFDQFRLRQRYALLTLWFSTRFDNTTWVDYDGWVNMPDECDWFGISCVSLDSGDGIWNHSAVESILLPLNALVGRLSPDLSLLTRLSYLDLSQNSLSGTLPVEFEAWAQLYEFKLHGNDFSGTIPPEYGYAWTNLNHFNVGSNGFNGVLPYSIGEWRDLVVLNAESNNFMGIMFGANATYSWSTLEFMDLSENSFTGTIPDDFGSFTLSMTEFRIANNNMTGTIPASLGAWRAMAYFDASENSFTGTLPLSISNWLVASVVNLTNNDLVGVVPSGLCNLTSVTYLAVDIDALECLCCDCCI